MKKESFLKGVSFTLLSATGLSLVGFLGKLGIEKFTLTGLIFWRFLAAFLFTLAFLWLKGALKGLSHFENIRMQLLRACFVLGSQYSFFSYLQSNTLLNATVLLNTGPLFIPLIEWGVLRSRVGLSSWAGIIVSFVGVLCILQPDAGIFSLNSAIGLFAGLSQGASQVVFGFTARSERAEGGVLHLFFLCALFSFFPFIFFNSTWLQQGVGGGDLIVWLGIASICNQLARAAAYRHGSPSRLAPFLYLTVVLAGFLDWLAFGRVPNALSIIGAGLVVLGGALKIYLRFHILRKKS